MLTFLLWISPVIVIAVIAWRYRRQAAAREAASAERFKAFLGKTTAQDTAAAVPAAPAISPAPLTPAVSGRAPVEFSRRERLLTPPQTLLFYLLKSALSDHEVLTQVSAASVLDGNVQGSSLERDARQRRLSSAVLDFVVCDKSFKPIAVVQCGVREASAAETLAYVRAGCESVGLRWVVFAPDAQHRRESIRPLVLGA